MGILGRNNMAPKKKPDEEEEVEEDPGPPPVEEGNGVFIFPDSTKFDGQWQKGGELGEDFRRHGQGTHIDGEQSYEGQWCNDAMHGQGTFRYASNAVYEGLWAANHYEGEGKYSWPNGASYTGAWVASRMHGKANTSTKRASPGKAAFTTVSDRDLAQLYDRGAFCHIRLHCLLRSDRTNPRPKAKGI